MPKFSLMSDQTNITGERLVTWACQDCHHEIIIKEFRFKELPPVVHMPCEVCELLRAASDAADKMTEEELEAYAKSLH